MFCLTCKESKGRKKYLRPTESKKETNFDNDVHTHRKAQTHVHTHTENEALHTRKGDPESENLRPPGRLEPFKYFRDFPSPNFGLVSLNKEVGADRSQPQTEICPELHDSKQVR